MCPCKAFTSRSGADQCTAHVLRMQAQAEKAFPCLSRSQLRSLTVAGAEDPAAYDAAAEGPDMGEATTRAASQAFEAAGQELSRLDAVTDRCLPSRTLRRVPAAMCLCCALPEQLQSGPAESSCNDT